jgi:mRNA-degrading endonuclease RelE of RelBE toxin-antitoxin system
MPSELEKFFVRVTPKEKKLLSDIITRILDRNLKNLDIKKLTGTDNIFRVRKGILRIVFSMTKTDIKIISVERRNDTTYNV